MRNLFAPSWTLRRLAFASVWALVVTVFAGGAIGFAAAGSASADLGLPSTFGVASPAVGDRGDYAATPVVIRDATAVAAGPSTIVASFEWMPPVEQRTSDGRTVAASRLRYWDEGMPHVTSSTVNDGKTFIPEQEFYFESADGAFMGSSQATFYAIGKPGQGQLNLPGEIAGDRAGRTFVFADEEPFRWVRFCGLFNLFQGNRIDSSHDVRPFGECWLPGGLYVPQPTFRAVATQMVDGHEAVVFLETSAVASEARRMWLAPDVPYPVRLLVPDPSTPGNAVLISLLSYHPGSGRSPLGAADSAPLAPISTAAWPGGVLDESGVVHPFPLSAALRYALDDSGELRSYLASHPDAYLLHAHYNERKADDTTKREWFLVHGDPGSNIATCLGQVQEPIDSDRIPAVETGVAVPPQTRYEYANCSYGGAAPPRDAVPHAAPTVAALMQRWRAYASADFAAEDPDSWGFTVGCLDEACTTASLTFTAGVDHTVQDNSADPTLPQGLYQSYVFSKSMLDVGIDGRAQELAEFRQTYATDPLIGGPRPAESVPPEMRVAFVPAPFWTLPTGAFAVAAGLVGLVSGVLYWLWPSLKAGAVGLFSRVERPTALDQPARATIAALVEAHPGIHFQEIARRTAMGHGAVDHHLRKLVGVGILAEQRAGGYNCYFPKGAVDRRLMAAAPVLKAPGARAVLSEVATGQRSGREIAAATGLDPGTVSYHVKKLAAASLVALERQGREVRVAATDLGRTALSNAA